MFTFDQLAAFIAVAEELHFGRAAERLNMTQPPLSRQIQRLERFVGADLLERTNRKVQLTPAGDAFLKEAKRLTAFAERAPAAARRIASGRSGYLRIGFTAASGLNILGPLLEEIAGILPDVDVELQELVTGKQISSLLTGELDLGLARPPFDDEIFDSRLLNRESMLLAVPSGHPLAGLDRELEYEDFGQEPLIMHSATEARYFYDLVVRMFPIRHGNVVHTVSQIVTMVSLVAANRGVAFVPGSATQLGIRGVEFLPLKGSGSKPVELHAIWNRSVNNPALSRLLRDLELSPEKLSASRRSPLGDASEVSMDAKKNLDRHHPAP